MRENSGAKRAKAAGLGKLKFFCQMCQKQCRDENGFKCHTLSDGHIRQMELFRQNPSEMMDDFSNRFEKGYLKLLSLRWRTKVVSANLVYNEFIKEKEHVHMNSTKWESLSSFARYLGQTGKVFVSESERGLMVRWIDPSVHELEAEQVAKSKLKQFYEERRRDELKRKVNLLRKVDAEGVSTSVHEGTSLEVNASLSPFILTSSFHSGNSRSVKKPKHSAFSDYRLTESPVRAPSAPTPERSYSADLPALPGSQSDSSPPLAVKMDGIVHTDEPWLMKGITVRNLNKDVGKGHFFKKKGVVRKIVKRFGGKIEFDTGENVVLDQKHLETVIPKPGKGSGNSRVMILKGPMKGIWGELIVLELHEFKGVIKLERGAGVVEMEYDAFSKYK